MHKMRGYSDVTLMVSILTYQNINLQNQYNTSITFPDNQLIQGAGQRLIQVANAGSEIRNQV